MVSSQSERIIAGLGGGLANLIVFALTLEIELSLEAETVLVASMGASAVLLFAVPHGLMSQPWNVIGGHLISALIGMLVHRLIADVALASALAVGLAISAMYYLRCLHPPAVLLRSFPSPSAPQATATGLRSHCSRLVPEHWPWSYLLHS